MVISGSFDSNQRKFRQQERTPAVDRRDESDGHPSVRELRAADGNLPYKASGPGTSHVRRVLRFAPDDCMIMT